MVDVYVIILVGGGVGGAYVIGVDVTWATRDRSRGQRRPPPIPRITASVLLPLSACRWRCRYHCSNYQSPEGRQRRPDDVGVRTYVDMLLWVLVYMYRHVLNLYTIAIYGCIFLYQQRYLYLSVSVI